MWSGFTLPPGVPKTALVSAEVEDSGERTHRENPWKEHSGNLPRTQNRNLSIHRNTLGRGLSRMSCARASRAANSLQLGLNSG